MTTPFDPPRVAERRLDPHTVLVATRWPVLLVGLGLGAAVLAPLTGLVAHGGAALSRGDLEGAAAALVAGAGVGAMGLVPWRAVRLALALDRLARTPTRAHLLDALDRQRRLWTASALLALAFAAAATGAVVGLLVAHGSG